MVHITDFFHHLMDADQNKAIMARIAVNAMEGPAEFRVDISELRKLTGVNRAVVLGYVAWVVRQKRASNISVVQQEGNIARFKAIACETDARNVNRSSHLQEIG